LSPLNLGCLGSCESQRRHNLPRAKKSKFKQGGKSREFGQKLLLPLGASGKLLL